MNCDRALRLSNDRFRLIGLAVITIAFLTSRLALLSAGVLIEVRPDFVQLLDFQVVSSHLIQSIYYLHSQPPLLNLLLGIGLKLSPHNYPLFFQFIFWLIGFSMAVSLYGLMNSLGVRWWISLIATVLFEISPATLLFENLYYDTYPTTFLLCFAAFALQRFLSRGRRFYGYAFVIALGLPVFLNATFQITWFAAIGAIMLFFAHERIRPLIPAGLAMLALILVLYVKNLLLFGTFTTSSWLGIPFTATTTHQLPYADRKELVREGKLSQFVMLRPFPVLAVPKSARSGIPALDQQAKANLAFTIANCNSLPYIALGRLDASDALWVIMHRPSAYLHGVWRGLKNYYEPASLDLPYLQRDRIGRWCEMFEAVLSPSGVPTFALDPRMDLVGWLSSIPGTGVPSTILIIAMPLLLAFGIATIGRRAWLRGLTDPGEVTLLFIVAGIVYLTPFGILVTFGENNRYRYILDPFFVVLTSVFLTSGFNWLGNISGTLTKQLPNE